METDLRKFYDKVTPDLLFKKLKSTSLASKGDAFISLFEKLFNWRWHDDDFDEISRYEAITDCNGFCQGVALAQGLASA